VISSSGFVRDKASTQTRKETADINHLGLCRRRTCELLHVTRSSTYHEPKPMTIRKEGERRMGKIDRIHLAHPENGARKVARKLTRAGLSTSRSVAGRLMR
jgi:putative transposase